MMARPDEPDPASAAAILRIDLDALVANYRLIVRRTAPAQVAGVVKADGYGLGAVEISRALMMAGCRHFFVAHLGEAEHLMPHLSQGCRLYVLNGLPPGAEAACAGLGAIPVLNSLDQLTRWSALASRLGRRLPAVLQVDSGMARLGLPPEEVALLLAEKHRLDEVELCLLMSHLACADDPESPTNPAQAARFAEIAAHFPGVPCSLDNSGGAFLDKSSHHDLVRPGIALYGGAPHFGRPNPMRGVVSLEARIMQLREVPPGGGVGYGLSFTAYDSCRIATIGVGYADGWLRQLSQRSSVFIAGIRVPLAGRISMDSITLDVTHVPTEHLYPGAPVELLGPHQTIDDVAADARTIAYEVLTRLGHRFLRDYVPSALGEAQRRRSA